MSTNPRSKTATGDRTVVVREDPSFASHITRTDNPHVVTAVQVGAPSTATFNAHHTRHENGGADEISVAGLSGQLADPQPTLGHHTSHEDGGADEISVTGLSGLLADPQTSKFFPNVRVSTDFEDIGTRFTTTVGGTGAASSSTNGLNMVTGATIDSFVSLRWTPGGGAQNGGSLTVQPGVFTTLLQPQGGVSLGSDFQVFVGIGVPTVAGTGITLSTAKHIGFYIERIASGAVNVYASQGDGTAQTLSAVLDTLLIRDTIRLCLRIAASTGSVDYYTQKNGGAWSGPTTLTNNRPTTALAVEGVLFAITNAHVAASTTFSVSCASYEKQ